MISIRQHVGNSERMAGLDAVRKSGVSPIDEGDELLIMITNMMYANVTVPPWYGVAIHRLIATLEAHGLSKE